MGVGMQSMWIKIEFSYDVNSTWIWYYFTTY